MSELHFGDCMKLMKKIPDNFVDLILCDLPYGTTNCRWDTVLPLKKLWQQYKRIIKPSGAIVLTATQPFATQLIHSNIEQFRYDIIWKKNIPTGFLNANKMPLRKHELVLIFYESMPIFNPQMTHNHLPQHSFDKNKVKNKSFKIDGDVYGKTKPTMNPGGSTSRFPTSVIEIPDIGRTSKERTGHPTQKPIALMEWLIKTYTNENMMVLDNCIGSGTTAIACDNLNRQWIGIDLDQEFFKKALERINLNRSMLSKPLLFLNEQNKIAKEYMT
jgi:DNA modification methylase